MMRTFLRLFATLAIGLASVSASAQLFGEPQLLEPEKAFRISARALDERNIEVVFKIAAGYYMYRERFSFASASGQPLAGVEIPHGKRKQDAFFGTTETFRDWVRIRIPVDTQNAGKDSVEIRVTSQGCSDQGVCYIPMTQTVHVPLVRGKQ
jgi:thioredoxin:protein disulfide reductase